MNPRVIREEGLFMIPVKVSVEACEETVTVGIEIVDPLDELQGTNES